MSKPLVIIHGWSDHAASFLPLAHQLQHALGEKVRRIDLADYVSMDDALRYDDVVHALDRAWDRHQLPRTPQSVDVIVHSTGALVIRMWMQRCCARGLSPIDHCLMLAPANFGSPLAHQGQALLGRVVKGFGQDRPFQVGSHLLRGLEIGSPFTFDLALADCFSHSPFQAAGVKTTILIGNTGYSGLAALANRPGTDGTVRLSNANLNSLYYQVNFHPEQPYSDHHPCIHPRVEVSESKGQIAFRVMPGFNHAGITGVEGALNRDVLAVMLKALTVDEHEFSEWCQDCQSVTDELGHQEASGEMGYQSLVIRCRDQYGYPVPDYFLCMTNGRQDDHELTQRLHTEVIRDVHVYGGDASHRAFLLDTQALRQLLPDLKGLYLDVSASPELNAHGSRVGFVAQEGHLRMPWQLTDVHLNHWLQSEQTILLDITLSREAVDEVLRLRKI